MTALAGRELPPRAGLPGWKAQALLLARGPHATASSWRASGSCARVRLPALGEAVAVADPALVKQVFTAPADVVHGATRAPLARTLGRRSSFALDGDEHLAQRKILLPPFHGSRMAGYADTFEEETLREIAAWPADRDFASLPSMMRITLNAILRTVFGAHDRDFDELRALMPSWVKLGSWLTALPAAQRDIGPGSPWRRFLNGRARFDEIVDRLIDEGRSDPALGERTDVLAMLLRATYDDGSPMGKPELKDQLLAILVAGHETTAAQLAWTLERLRRHPELLPRLRAEDAGGGSALRDAVIRESQRLRPVIIGVLRWVHQPFELGPWTLPPGTLIFVDAAAIHGDPELYPNPGRFDPDRFLDRPASTYAWVPFGGGRRRCVGAAFAHLEMDVVLRTILRTVDLVPTSEPGERWRFRGVAFQPAKGGVVRIRRRVEASGVSAPSVASARPEAA